MLCLDSALSLTRGSPLGPLATLANLHPREGSYTVIATPENGELPLAAQMHYHQGERSAHLTCVLPEEACASPAMNGLLENLAWQAGNWGAFNLLAEVDELSPAYEALRRSGFTIYSWQRIWRLTAAPQPRVEPRGLWQPVSEIDEQAVRSLYGTLAPPLVQSAEALPARRLRGLVHRQGELKAYVAGMYGPRGIFLNPLIHPDVEGADELLADLVSHLPMQLNRPVYFAVRSYLAWLEPTLERLNAEVTDRRALLVKHLTNQLRVPAHNPRLAVLENNHRQTEPTAPMLHNTSVHKS